MATNIEWTRGDDGTKGAVWNPTTGCDRITDQGVDYDADDNGYIEVPEPVGNLLHKSRGGKGERWYTPQEVFEEISIGRMEEAVRRADVPVQRGPVRVAP